MRFMMLMIPKDTKPRRRARCRGRAVAAMMKITRSCREGRRAACIDGLHPPDGRPDHLCWRRPKVTDGPFAEAKEVLGGYWMIKVKSRQEAIDWPCKLCFGQ